MTTKLKRGKVFVFAIASGLGVANLYYNQPTLADMASSFHVPAHEVGLIPMFAQFGYALGLLLIVPLGDILERRRFIAIMLGLVTCALLSAAIAPNVTWLAAANFAIGVTTVVPHIILPLVALLAEPKEQGKVLGMVMSGVFLGAVLSRSMGGLIGHIWGWRSLYWLAAGLMLLLSLVLVRQIPLIPSQLKLTYPNLMRSLLQVFRSQPRLREAALNGALLFAAFSAFWATLVFHLSSLPQHYDSSAIGLLALMAIPAASFAPVVGKIADRYGARLMVGVGIGCAIAAFITFWLGGQSLWGLAGGIFLLSVGTQANMVSNQARIFPLIPDAKSRLNTVYMVSYFIGGATGSFVGTMAWSLWQWHGVCAIALSLAVIDLLIHLIGGIGGSDRKVHFLSIK
jgi:predicted MFS family arabinose efflux permease